VVNVRAVVRNVARRGRLHEHVGTRRWNQYVEGGTFWHSRQILIEDRPLVQASAVIDANGVVVVNAQRRTARVPDWCHEKDSVWIAVQQGIVDERALV